MYLFTLFCFVLFEYIGCCENYFSVDHVVIVIEEIILPTDHLAILLLRKFLPGTTIPV